MSQDGNSPEHIPLDKPINGCKSIGQYYNASRLRTETWDSLQIAVNQLSDRQKQILDLADVEEETVRYFQILEPIESFFAFPGRRIFRELKTLYEDEDYDTLLKQVTRIVRLLVCDAYRTRDANAIINHELIELDHFEETLDGHRKNSPPGEARPYFELLVVDELATRDEAELQHQLLTLRRDDDDFIYDVVIVPSFEDALIAVLFNHSIQACVIRYSFLMHTDNELDILRRYIDVLENEDLENISSHERSITLGHMIKRVRPELDLYLVTNAPVEDIAGEKTKDFRRIFYRQEDYKELHQTILMGIYLRFETPFFDALREYTAQPTGVFHAMPISRGKSINKSHWIQDIEEFYGSNIFMAETSATIGGLDSLLQPLGALRKAQDNAARAFGAKKTFFVTNGTSTANKIVMQALVQPGDIVLVSRDCHKSHHYALILLGAYPVYLDPYPLSDYSMYGAVPISTMKKALLDLKKKGKLEKVRMVLLTNCTFDGVTYHPLRVMRSLLAIKPDLIFLWDEAWFGYAYFTPVTRHRCAMEAASDLRLDMKSPEYHAKYQTWKEANKDNFENEDWITNTPLLAGPEKARIRVYATQSTHKTLTSMRQGSMIHIHDQDFDSKAQYPFMEAYMTHTSTSPNYQILASLDVGRRQVELEGYELVSKSIELAMALRERIQNTPLIKKYFKLLGPKHLIPAEHRESQIEYYYSPNSGWTRMEEAYDFDEFTLDPTRITLLVANTGMDGDEFKQFLMNNHHIQINKTSRNTVLFMIHIGTTRDGVAQLLEVLSSIAAELEEREEDQNPIDCQLQEAKVRRLTKELPPLPNFSSFHPKFHTDDDKTSIEGDMRKAFFMSYEASNCEYLKIDGSVLKAIESGREVVSVSFVTPYPPGFPVLVPGQIVSKEILGFLKALDVKEIHGYQVEYGLRIFTEDALSKIEAPVASKLLTNQTK